MPTMKHNGLKIKCKLFAVAMCISSELFASPQYKIEVSVESDHQALYFYPFYVSEGLWGKTEARHCVYRGQITRQDSGLQLESKMDCHEGTSHSYYEMPIFVVKPSGGEVSITYGDAGEDGDWFWKYSAKILPIE
ncbi:hypothetical protein OMR72_003530 [Vibrio parahaemolyticus]|uniref:hypothetical protein n=1 Tax=Vibrio parahaemolyticus TaxID=670 RepID=UPI00112245B5|nr:hypothetical protein [Vibrio parahaemolyticus]EJG1013477.1 hypothetical protein [Vibrio parahaemolyticus]EKA8935263.1 hypothetical protein [Vibrio parahaemolyticus]EKF6610907.1 hypothetical protein [Vibrio parahaemolyticus]MBE4000053.1 hypothetical protein [Vibrio parahaemolyticus]TON63366.1 hypothetical protein CGH54_02695 [Vibrio parahaemolyticus]